MHSKNAATANAQPGTPGGWPALRRRVIQFGASLLSALLLRLLSIWLERLLGITSRP